MKKRIIIVGRGASGKDYIRQQLQSIKGLNYCVSYTTRPKRSNEEEGKDYYFCTHEDYIKFLMSDKGIVNHCISELNWNYFFDLKDIIGSQYNLFVMDPIQIKQLPNNIIKSSLILYINTPLKIIQERLSKRHDVDNVERRIQYDNVIFKDFKIYDLELDGSKNNTQELKELIKILNV
ncbi:MAG: hypothetical protein RSE41_02610 [Clostridia bacterium]